MEEVNFYGTLISVPVTLDRTLGVMEYGIIRHQGLLWRVRRLVSIDLWEVVSVLHLK